MKTLRTSILILTIFLFASCEKNCPEPILSKEVTYKLFVTNPGYKMTYEFENFGMQSSSGIKDKIYDTTVIRNIGDTLYLYIMSETTPDYPSNFTASIIIDNVTTIEKSYDKTIENRIDDTITYILK